MGFPDIYFDELHLLMVFLVDLLETHGPFDIRRSGEASKDQSYRGFPLETAQVQWVLSVDFPKLKVWRQVADFGGLGIVFFLPRGGLVTVLDSSHII